MLERLARLNPDAVGSKISKNGQSASIYRRPIQPESKPTNILILIDFFILFLDLDCFPVNFSVVEHYLVNFNHYQLLVHRF